MATIKSNGQSYLEAEGIESRKEQTGRSDYNSNDPYQEKHKDALADGDSKGKGTGDFAGHGWSVPDMTKPKSEMAYGNFNTTDGGNDCDHMARNTMMNRSLYGPGKQYYYDLQIDTAMSRADGQYDGTERTRISYVCPIL